MNKKKLEPISPVKQAWGLLLIALGYWIIATQVKGLGISGKVGIIWLVILYLLHTWGELCLSPIGLSLVAKLAPKRFASLLMGVWFLGNAGGYVLTGVLGALLPPTTEAYVSMQKQNIDLKKVLDGEKEPSGVELYSLAKEKIATTIDYEKAMKNNLDFVNILNNPDSLKKFEQSDLPENIKQEFLQKADEVKRMLDPIEKQKSALGQDIKDTTDFIKQATERMNAEPDPVKKAELEVRIEQANKDLEESNNKLKGLIKEQIKPSTEEDLTTDEGIKSAQEQFNIKSNKSFDNISEIYEEILSQ
jgi:hypothetical protein